MEELHEQVLDYLLDWQRKSNSSREQPLFYLRRANDERFKRGYWFPGTDDYLLISFWAGSDMRNKTPNAYFRIHLKQGCSGHLTARDSPVKRDFFEELASKLDDYQAQQRKAGHAGAWQAKKSDVDHWQDALMDYIYHDKEFIDDSLIKNDVGGVGDEFDTKFTFLDPGAFDQSLRRVLIQQDQLRAERNRSVHYGYHSSFNYSSRQGVIGLTRFKISNFQGIQYASVEGLNPTSRWVFLTGENGFGKTSILRAIAHALGGPLEADKTEAYLHSTGADQQPAAGTTGFKRAQLEIGYERDGEPGAIVKTVGFAEEKLSGYLGHQIVAYGPIRLGVLEDSTQNRPAKQQNNVFSIFNPIGSRLYNADYELNQAFLTASQEGGNLDRFYLLVQLIQTITAERVSMVQVTPSGQVLYWEADDSGNVLAKATSYRELATGYQSLINLVIDLYLRLAGSKATVKPNELVGLVLIDELENHLHPHLQRELPLRLRMLFPLVQFVVSTHSPIPLLGAPDNAIFLRVDRDLINGITVRQLDLDISNLMPNSILSSPIFGFQELVPESHNGKEWIQTGDYATVVKDQEEQSQLAQYLTKERQEKLLSLLKPKE
jgi:hypothetical protein